MLPWSSCIRTFIIKLCLFSIDLIASGIILFLAQSPPPITFPALPTPTLILLSLKKDFVYELITNSAAPFEPL